MGRDYSKPAVASQLRLEAFDTARKAALGRVGSASGKAFNHRDLRYHASGAGLAVL